MTADEWLAAGASGGAAALTVLGAPIGRASISPSTAWTTPPAVRSALRRLPTWDAQHRIDIGTLAVRDLGDVEGDRFDPDARAAHQRIEQAVYAAAAEGGVVAVIGGDNSLTRPAMFGMMRARSDCAWGLLTLDAHHDARPLASGSTNGTVVRELITSGLPGTRVVQIGIHPWGNGREYADWTLAQGVTVHDAPSVRRRGIEAVVADALTTLGHRGVEAVYVDFDVDVVDRAHAPACPASLPGGLSPHDFLAAAWMAAASPRVAAVDITEVDASRDVAETTVRLAALTLVTIASGIASRIS